MSLKQQYDQVFLECFGVKEAQLDEDLAYQSIQLWDSVGHMAMIAQLEDVFDIMLDMDDIIDFSSYKVGIEILKKYGVEIPLED